MKKKKKEKRILVNLKVLPSDLARLDKKADQFTKGNRSRLFVQSALERKTPFEKTV